MDHRRHDQRNDPAKALGPVRHVAKGGLGVSLQLYLASFGNRGKSRKSLNEPLRINRYLLRRWTLTSRPPYFGAVALRIRARLTMRNYLARKDPDAAIDGLTLHAIPAGARMNGERSSCL
jgi:hypothetical protein